MLYVNDYFIRWFTSAEFYLLLISDGSYGLDFKQIAFEGDALIIELGSRPSLSSLI
jgi:hypothetical protein